MSADVGARTICACPACVACCQRPASLHPGDFERIAAYLGEDPITARRHFVASPGALVARVIDGVIRPFRIGTITPAVRAGRCVFQDDAGRCGIHPVAPFGCAMFDMHMPAAVAAPRSAFHIRAIAGSPEYAALRASLPASTPAASRK